MASGLPRRGARKSGGALFSGLMRQLKGFLYRRKVRWPKREVQAMALRALGVLGRECPCCGQTVKRVAYDHVFPSARGGSDKWWNINPIHEACNRAKGALSGVEFNALVAHLRGHGIARYVLARLKAGWRVGWLEDTVR